ncbi:MAG: rhodanese-like domain-containing protein [Rhodoferax sp.]|nr:rhodanese-like domain-containing protein [Rhodoferax sp.]
MTKLLQSCCRLLSAVIFCFGAQTVLAAGAVAVRQGAAMQSQGALLVDVRTPAEFARGHAPGAVLIPLDQIGQRLGELGAKDRPIALICRSGNRSGQAQSILEQAGFTKTVNVTGGMNAWEQAGLPAVKGQ